MYISNSSEKHIFDSGLDVFFYFIITVMFSCVVFLFDVSELLVEASAAYDDITVQITTTSSLSIVGLLFFSSIAYDFWSRYNSAIAKVKCIYDILLFLWIGFFCIALLFLCFVFMWSNQALFLKYQSCIMSIIKIANYGALVPFIISAVEGCRYIAEYHHEVIDKNTRQFNKSKQEYYHKTAV